jgi:hypothetical protein
MLYIFYYILPYINFKTDHELYNQVKLVTGTCSVAHCTILFLQVVEIFCNKK